MCSILAKKGESGMVVKCPSCGQQVRGEPGQSGPCPKCGQRFAFPVGDPMLGEPITCPHCGQTQRYQNGLCAKCGRKLTEAKFVEEPVAEAVKNTSHHSQKSGRGGKTNPLIFVAVVALLLFLLAQCGEALGKGDGSSCYICGKPSVYTTSSGYGFCGEHLIDALDYDER